MVTNVIVLKLFIKGTTALVVAAFATPESNVR
jgi:hypothetical protein